MRRRANRGLTALCMAILLPAQLLAQAPPKSVAVRLDLGLG